ncbi:MAG: ParB N-terminal domain-containing protein [Actinomycetota bacterium]
MRWDHLPDLTAFDQARRRQAYRRLARAVGARGEEPLLEMDELRGRLRLFDQSYVGIEPIPVDRVVGTTSRSRDFDRDFLPRDEDVRERWRRIEQAFPRGDFPPIVVYRIGGSYFLVDGHHRVAVARHRGVEFIDAEITELRSRVPLPADADVGRLILLEQEARFMDESALERARPEGRIECSRPQGYVELIEQVRSHGYRLVQERGEVVSPEEAAGDWYDRVYLPTVEAIHRARLHADLSGAPDGDLFLWTSERRRALGPQASTEEALRVSPPGGRPRRTARTRRARRPRPRRTS